MAKTVPTVIAFLGTAGSGKSTAARHLQQKYGSYTYGFAYPVKALAKKLFDFTDEQIYGDYAAKEQIDPRYGKTPRDILKALGHGLREEFGMSVHTNACFNHLINVRNDHSLISLEDCRYVNEAGFLRDNSNFRYLVIKLVCPNSASTADPTHPSEAEVDQVPPSLLAATIVSNTSPGAVDLLSKLDNLLVDLWVTRPLEDVIKKINER